jgi:hypothetical protein
MHRLPASERNWGKEAAQVNDDDDDDDDDDAGEGFTQKERAAKSTYEMSSANSLLAK